MRNKQMRTIEDTLALIKEAHAGKVDKVGVEYWRHPVSVMNRIPCATTHECHVALLHDLIEDTHYTPRDLLGMGYEFDVVWDVNTVTRRRSSGDYRHWIMAIAVLGSKSAIRVKIADLEDNLDESRLAKLPHSEAVRLRKKYREALPLLQNALSKRIAYEQKATNG